jgi:hypothetical protein
MRSKTGIAIFVVAVAALWCAPARAQDDQTPTNQWQISASLTANIQRTATNSGVSDTPTKAGGIVFSARYHYKPRIWFEANGGFTSFTQYYEPVASEEQANIYEGTAAIVYSFKPEEAKIKPFVEAGGGVLYFSPVATGSTPGGSKAPQPSGMAGVGVDWRLSPHLSWRLGFRGLVYKPPSFGIETQTVNTITGMYEPYIGLAIHF